ncbi:peptidoglycan recognition protein 1 [Chamberlinius hualienensis]
MNVFGKSLVFLAIAALSLAAPREKRDTGCNAITIIKRNDWGAPATSGANSLTTPVRYVFIHHTDGKTCSSTSSCSSIVKGIYNDHIKNRKFDDIGYSFLIGGDGKVYEGRGWGKEGAHTYGWNKEGYGISFIGKYKDSVPPTVMQEAAKNLVLCGISKNEIQTDYGLYGHRDGTCTECPGDAFYNSLNKWNNWHKHGTIKKHCSG